ncbi:MAG TPA: hypothetical protein VFL47_06095 [Flavisolibacter sp.]|nr:hypothetical protein [Flavisolibacter sp.]
MKLVLFVLLVTSMAFSDGCKKDSEAITSIKASTLSGTWELRQLQGGMMPAETYPAGNGNRLTFTGNKYERYRNGSLEKRGTFALVMDTTVKESVGLQLPAGQFTTRIIYDDDVNATKVFIDLQQDKLHLLSGFFPTDGGSRLEYEKIADTQQ